MFTEILLLVCRDEGRHHHGALLHPEEAWHQALRGQSLWVHVDIVYGIGQLAPSPHLLIFYEHLKIIKIANSFVILSIFIIFAAEN